MAPPKPKKPGVVGRISSLVKGHKGSLDVERSQDAHAPLPLDASASGSGSPKPARSGEVTLLDTANAGILEMDQQGNSLIRRLNPILDASHTRDRARSPPDSECYPGTREEPVRKICAWADSGDSKMVQGVGHSFPEEHATERVPHIYWLHGSEGGGKSSISLEVANIYAGSGRLLASYFFSRGAKDRSTMNRFAVTLASQLAVAIPTAAPSIEAAVMAEHGTVTSDVTLAKQLDLLVLSPFQDVISGGGPRDTFGKRPFLIVVDGLDECQDKEGVRMFIDHMLAFFKKHPSIPLRVFIASRVEQHIDQCLRTSGVQLDDLDSHSPRNDIEKVLQASFQTAEKQEGGVQTYVRANGEWLIVAESEMDKLLKHIGGSFFLAAAVFKFIVQPAIRKGPLTPMDRLPPIPTIDDLDDLYAQILARSQHLPHFYEIISTIARFMEPLTIVGIADLLGIENVEVVRVLLNTQVIVRVLGTHVVGEVTLCHASFRDFLITETRSKTFFVPQWFHLRLSYYCFASNFERRYGKAYTYGLQFLYDHLLTLLDGCNFINEIEQVNARPTSFVERVPFHTFICSMCFYSIAWGGSPFSDRFKDLLTECAKQLALAVEYPDSRVRFWLQKELINGRMSNSIRMVEFTEETCTVVQQHLRRVSTALYAKFPGLLDPQPPTSIGTEKEHQIGVYQFSGINIFKALAWIVAYAHFKWEEAKIRSRRPLELSIFYNKHRTKIIFSFEGASDGDESD